MPIAEWHLEESDKVDSPRIAIGNRHLEIGNV
jgi:hypothetical protein